MQRFRHGGLQSVQLQVWHVYLLLLLNCSYSTTTVKAQVAAPAAAFSADPAAVAAPVASLVTQPAVQPAADAAAPSSEAALPAVPLATPEAAALAAPLLTVAVTEPLISGVEPALQAAAAATCSWPGHCLGDPCVTYNDCDGTMICVNNKCALLNPSPSPSPSPKPSPSPSPKPSPSPSPRPSPSPSPRPSPSPSPRPSPSPSPRPSPSPSPRPSPSPSPSPRPSPQPSPYPCSWAGHCLGDPCVTNNDCDGTLICVSSKCALLSPPPPPSPSPSPRPPSPKPSPSPVPSPAPGGCAAGWQRAAGTVYDSWPYPGSPEAVNNNGVTWSGLFNSISPSATCSAAGEVKITTGVCSPAGACPTGTYSNECRFGDALVAKFKMASIYPASYGGKKLWVYSPNYPNRPAILVNALDTCSDTDCGGCCTQNKDPQTGLLLDLEKAAAKALYGVADVFNTITYSGATATFSNPTGRLYDINTGTDMNGPLCFQVANIPAVVNGVPTDDAGNPVVLA